jgi:sugar transferase (PEP-CTERM/EpsH1 system associated)
MRVLFVCHRFPFPPQRGGKIRPFNIIRHLHRQGHEVLVASLARSVEEERAAAGIREHCTDFFVARVAPFAAAARMVLRLPTLQASSMGYFYSPDLQRQVSHWVATRKPDLIFAHCSSIAQFVDRVAGIPKILDYGDMDSQKWLDYVAFKPWPLSLGYWLEGKKVERQEKLLAKRFDLSTCTTRGELETLDSFHVANSSGWFPNGVDSEYFKPDGDSYDPETVCFVGRMDYFPNQQAVLEFCTHVLPALRQSRPTVKFLIVGAEPSAEIRALSKLPGVTVTGSVPDVRPFVRRAAMTIAPLKIARGTQNKIIESMAMGVPVITSPAAARGVDAIPGEHLLVADAHAEWSSQIQKLLSDHGERQRLATNGRARVLAHHDWSRSMQRLDELIDHCMRSKRNSRDDAQVSTRGSVVL